MIPVRWLIKFLVVVMALGVTTKVQAQATPRVLVTFRIVERTFVNTYPALRALEAKAADSLVMKLNSTVRYLTFVTQRPAEYELAITLDRLDRGGVGPSEVGFYAALSGPIPRQVYWKPYRTANQYLDPRGTSDYFLGQLKVKVNRDDVERLSRMLLRQIPIASARTAVTWPPLAWVLPFNHRALCLGKTSSFRIVNVYRNANGPVEYSIVAHANQEFDPRPLPAAHTSRRNNVLAVADLQRNPTASELRTAIARNRVEVKSVFVDEYYMDPLVCAQPVSPAEAFARGGGGE